MDAMSKYWVGVLTAAALCVQGAAFAAPPPASAAADQNAVANTAAAVAAADAAATGGESPASQQAVSTAQHLESEQPVKLAKDVTPAEVKTMKTLLKSINPQAHLDSIEDSPFPGIKTLVAGTNVLYASNDGRYLMFGALLDTKTKENLTDNVKAGLRINALRSIPARDIISFRPKHVKYTVTAFTDTSCEFCQALFKNAAGYLKAGIAINYVPWPRAGMQAPNMVQMQSVWCAKNRQVAYADAMTGKQVDPASCAVDSDFPKIFALGEGLGINGTPAIFDAHGQQIGGFLPPAQMLARLQQLNPVAGGASSAPISHPKAAD